MKLVLWLTALFAVAVGVPIGHRFGNFAGAGIEPVAVGGTQVSRAVERDAGRAVAQGNLPVGRIARRQCFVHLLPVGERRNPLVP